jgi:predicted ABC-type ATPase
MLTNQDKYIIKELIKIVSNYENTVNNDKERWVTIKGTHILLKDGESIADAFKRVTGVSIGKSNKNKYSKPDKHKPSAAYSQTLARVNKSNQINYTQDEIINRYIKNNQNKISKEQLIKKIKNAEEYNANIAKTGRETFKYYSDGKGHYKPEREARHKKILNDLFINENMAKPKDGEKPTFMILGGRGGSGKSKFDGLVYDRSKYIVLDADAIKEKLPEYKGYNAFEVHEESSDILKKALKIARKKGLNVVWDGTMKSLKSVESKINDFKNSDYDIEMYYMHLPREKAAERAIGRFMGNNGRYVPLDVLLDMKENENNFNKLKHNASKWAFYNNDVPSKNDKPILVDKNY